MLPSLHNFRKCDISIDKNLNACVATINEGGSQ